MALIAKSEPNAVIAAIANDTGVVKMANAGLVRSDIIAILSTKFRRWKCKFYF